MLSPMEIIVLNADHVATLSSLVAFNNGLNSQQNNTLRKINVLILLWQFIQNSMCGSLRLDVLSCCSEACKDGMLAVLT